MHAPSHLVSLLGHCCIDVASVADAHWHALHLWLKRRLHPHELKKHSAVGGAPCRRTAEGHIEPETMRRKSPKETKA